MISEKPPGIGRSYMTTAKRLKYQQIAEVVECARRAFGANMGEQEVLDHLEGQLALVENEHGVIIGFGSITGSSTHRVARSEHTDFLPVNLKDVPAHYLAGAAVHPGYEGRGVYSRLTSRRLAYAIKRIAKTILTRTQDYRVEAGIRKSLTDLVKKKIIRGFTLRYVPLPGYHGRRLSERTPVAPPGTPYASLNLEAGDAVMLIFKIRYRRLMTSAS